ncbi:CaaX protease [Xylariaceae sp. FL0255]|nr:CaaX protease [Xylariaceae sp. FL0255]
MPAIPSYLASYFTTKEEVKPPPISTGTAAALLILYTLIYVIPFYLSPLTRPSRSLSRDAPSVIRARVTSVSVSCIVCTAITFLILTRSTSSFFTNSTSTKSSSSWSYASRVSGASGKDVVGRGSAAAAALHAMGYWPVGLAETGKALLLTAILFAGPLYESIVIEGSWRYWGRDVKKLVIGGDWVFWRNIVAGPLTEEILFRGASIPLMRLAQTPLRTTLFLSPALFGLAHVHHFYEFRVTHPHLPLSTGLIRSALQFSYTWLFGVFATFVFLRTGSLLGVSVVHAFCNVMGLPRVWGRVQFPDEEEDEGRDRKKAAVRRQRSVAWTVVYYVLLVAGAMGFYRYLWVLTESGNGSF